MKKHHDGFLRIKRETPSRRPVETRKRDWAELYEPFPAQSVSNQAKRCMDCGVPFCQSNTGCPVDNLIPEWNELAANGLWREALERLHETNNFPEFTGRLCPAPCESACVLGLSSEPVTIKTIEQSLIDRGFNEGWVKPLPSSLRTGRRVAIIGSGPAGLAAAQQLARKGHAVTVFEREPQVGGLLRYGIPDFKMSKSLIDRRVEQMEAEGVEFKTSTTVGRDLPLSDLTESFDAVCLAMGAERPRDLDVPGRDLAGIHFAMDYLVAQNRALSGEVSGETPISAAGKRVVILGGGDTGSDCVGTAHRQGAIEVTQIELTARPPDFRSPSTPWPRWPAQLRTSHAHEEGGGREWGLRTVAFEGKDGAISAILALPIDADGQPLEAVPRRIPADLVLLAMGFTGAASHSFLSQGAPQGQNQVALDSRGVIATDRSYQTSMPKVFAAGDVRRGASLIVWAIKEGRMMAEATHLYLQELGSETEASAQML